MSQRIDRLRDPDVSPAIGEVLRRLRLARRLTQVQVSKLSGVDRSFLAHIERGRSQPSLTTFFNLCAAYRVSPSQTMTHVMSLVRIP